MAKIVYISGPPRSRKTTILLSVMWWSSKEEEKHAYLSPFPDYVDTPSYVTNIRLGVDDGLANVVHKLKSRGIENLFVDEMDSVFTRYRQAEILQTLQEVKTIKHIYWVRYE